MSASHLGVLILCLWAACTFADQPAEASPSAAEAAAVLEASVVERRNLEGTVRLQGELHPFEQVDLHARVPAFVQEVFVDRGSRVVQGEVLVRLHAPELRAERRRSEAERRGEQSTLQRLEKARRTKGAVAEHDVELAAARLSAADAKTRSLRTLENYLVIEAPFDGVVSDRFVHPGALVDASGDSVMLRVEAIDTLRLVVAVPELWLGSVIEGTRVEFEVLAHPNRRFAGVVERRAERVDPATRTMAVELDVDNAAGELVPGAHAEVHWPLHRASESLFVPRTAIVETARDRFVVAVREGIARRVHVERGAVMAELVEVFGELDAGELVLTRARDDIEDGAAVTVAAAADAKR